VEFRFEEAQTNLNRVQKEHSAETRFDLQLTASDSNLLNRETTVTANFKQKTIPIPISLCFLPSSCEWKRKFDFKFAKRERERERDLEREREECVLFLFLRYAIWNKRESYMVLFVCFELTQKVKIKIKK